MIDIGGRVIRLLEKKDCGRARQKENGCLGMRIILGERMFVCVDLSGKWQNVNFGENSHTIAVVYD